jgi:hypothetical protein
VSVVQALRLANAARIPSMFGKFAEEKGPLEEIETVQLFN